MSKKQEYYYVSNIGLRRKKNQDNLICDNIILPMNHTNSSEIVKHEICGKNAIFGVFDGLGGEKDGEVASYITAKTFLENKEYDNLEKLIDICHKANDDVCDYMNQKEIDYMGTTAAVLCVTDEKIKILNIGDSKIFRISEEKTEQISVDHLDDSVLFQKPVLYQYVGIRTEETIIEPHTDEIDYKKNDCYLICSDGLTDMVSVERIKEIVDKTNRENTASLLLDEAIKNGGKDNITFILIYLE